MIRNQSVTSHYRHRVRIAATLPPLHQYLTAKFQWQNHTIQMIDWPSHSEIIRKYRDRRVTVVKHLFDISPTGKIANRNDPTLSHHCPACEEPHEDNKHVMRCGATSRQLWRQRTLNYLQNLDKPGNDPVLMDILQDGIRRYFMDIDPPLAAQYPARYARLIEEQATIGWDQIFKARWSVQWEQMQAEHTRQSTNTMARNPKKRWTTIMGRRMIERWLEVWDIRNEERHGKDADQKKAARLQHLKSQLEDLYSYRTKVCPADAHIFYGDVTEHIQKHPSLHQVEDWIAMNCEAIRASAALATKLGISRNRTITEYPTFNPAIQTDRQASLTAGLSAG